MSWDVLDVLVYGGGFMLLFAAVVYDSLRNRK